jgi:hypothetical protein
MPRLGRPRQSVSFAREPRSCAEGFSAGDDHANELKQSGKVGRTALRKSKFTHEQVTAIIKEFEQGACVEELCKRNEHRPGTGARAPVADSFTRLKEENNQLKHALAEAMLESRMLRITTLRTEEGDDLVRPPRPR